MTFLSADLSIRPSPVPLLTAGTTPYRLDRAARRGDLVVLARGIYAPADAYRALPPWERYLARVHAVARTRPDAIFGWESAAALSGLPLFGEPRHVHVLSPFAGTSRVVSSVREHTTVDRREIVRGEGIMITSPAETAVDLCRSRHQAVGVAVADAVLREDHAVGIDDLVHLNETRATSRGRRTARWCLERATALSETALESVSRCAIEWLGYPVPELQVEVRLGSRSYRLDMLWRREAVGGEADGRVKYDGSHGDPSMIAFEEKRREDALRRTLRGFARWGWPELQHPADLARTLEAAGLKQVQLADLHRLHTLPAALAGAE